MFESLFRALNAAGVRYVVVGGLATVLHGYARLTADVDLVVDLAPTEAKKVMDPMLVVDLFVDHPIEFDGLWSRATVIDLNGTAVRICTSDERGGFYSLSRRWPRLDATASQSTSQRRCFLERPCGPISQTRCGSDMSKILAGS